MEEERVTGIVLYATDLKEYDKRLVILTKEHGKITVFANGARRPKSPLIAATRSYTMGEFTVFRGRESYTLVKAEVRERFPLLERSMENLCDASYFAELMSYSTGEGDFCTEHLNLLYLSFVQLTEETLPKPLLRRIFELRLLSLEGEAPHAFSCLSCGKKELAFFDAAAGGFLCADCGKLRPGALPVSDGVVYTVQFILTAPLKKLFSFRLTEALSGELERVVDAHFSKRVEKQFKSLEILKGIL